MKFYDFEANDKTGVTVKMDEYRGKVVLVVNTATKCGFTPQYDDLQDLYEMYQDQGLEILEIEEKCKGITCGRRPTSCADQLACAVREAYEDGR